MRQTSERIAALQRAGDGAYVTPHLRVGVLAAAPGVRMYRVL